MNNPKEPSSAQQRIKINVLLPKHIKEDKEEKKAFMLQFTKDKARTSTTQLSYDEANDVIQSLGGKFNKNTTHSYYALFDKENVQHMAILSLCHQIGWIVYQPNLAKNVADLNQLGAWMQKHSYLKKSLKAYTAQEMPKLVKQFESVVKNYVK